MLRPPDLVGQQFGQLTVLGLRRVATPSGAFVYLAVCRCSCGVDAEVSMYVLRNGSQSCGCAAYKTRTGKSHPLFAGHGEIGISLWNRYKQHAAERGRCFEITIEHAWEMYLRQNRKCALSGVPIEFGSVSRQTKYASQITASLDRLDNRIGYVQGNVQWVHKTVNIMRNTLTIEDFRAWCHRVVITRQGGNPA